jgi:hypothetical protein
MMKGTEVSALMQQSGQLVGMPTWEYVLQPMSEHSLKT